MKNLTNILLQLQLLIITGIMLFTKVINLFDLVHSGIEFMSCNSQFGVPDL